MLFTETASLADPVQTKDVPPLVLYHHLIVRSNAIQLPHQMHSWQETEYVKFVSEHSDLENRRLIEAALKSWEEGDQTDASSEAKECASILHIVLQRNKQQ
jgi:acetolactate synthase-1/3 small subunit